MQISIAEFLKDIGRGHAGARSLSIERAERLFEAIFSGQVSDLELGGAMIALRMKGESVAEVQGALHALETYLVKVPVDASRPVVVIPSYNGARNMANLTPLLACLLADRGVQVVVHGVRLDPKRTTTHQILAAMGIAGVSQVAEARDVMARNDPVFIPIDLLSPALARLLDLRWILGVRNIGHTLAKLLNPSNSSRCLRMVSFTHPEFDKLQHQLLLEEKISALVMRGTEGEVVANARRQARIDFLQCGECATLIEAQVVASGDMPSLPPAHDALATAQWSRAVLAGERSVPDAIAQQVEAIMSVLELAPLADSPSVRLDAN
jgi:anthranilate phosphoribosyltransferase